MSISSYADLQTSVASWLHRSDLTSIIVDLIMLGEKRIQREVRTADMETPHILAISAGVLTVPPEFLGWKNVYVDRTPVQPLQVKPLDWIYLNYPVRSSTGIPQFIAMNGTSFEFGPYPDSNYTIKGTYFARLTSVATTWNGLATDSPDLYLFAALAESKPFLLDDQRIPIWEAKYAAIRDAINSENEVSNFAGSPLAVTVA